MAFRWTQPSKYSFGSFDAETHIEINLPVVNDSGVTYQIISGFLPDGVFLIGNKLKGSGYNTNNETLYTFCIRAKTSQTLLGDRTFSFILNDPYIPEFVTPEGLLAVGIHKQLYILDSTYVSYQIDAFELDAQGRKLSYFISSGDGSLPPGLTMSDTGLITGYIEPLPAITVESGNGAYGEGLYDAIAYDFGLLSTDGFDDYRYDDVFFDFSIPTQQVKTLNINYQFRVTLTDSINYVQRVFRILVVGTDEFRADSTASNGMADGFSADSTFVREPMWVGASNATGTQKLGAFKANNYLTIPVALYDNNNVIFRLETTNQEVYANAVQHTPTDNIIGSNQLTVTNTTATPVRGQYLSFEYYLNQNAAGTLYQIATVADLGNGVTRLTVIPNLSLTIPNSIPFFIGSLSTLPPGTAFNAGTGDVYGVVPYQPAITKTYKFTLTATRVSNELDSISSSRTFSIDIIGNITNIITWNSPSMLGTIDANYVCTLSVNATSNVPGANIVYEFTPQSLIEKLPPGLTLNPDGEFIGIVNQFYDQSTSTLGLITFDDKTTTFDQKTTTLDRLYTFTITATDQYGFNNVTKQFTVKIATPNIVTYSNIITRPFLKENQRTLWRNFITDTNVFAPSSVYRSNDPNFGLQENLVMLVYAGIETRSAHVYVSAMGLNHKRKRFHFGDVKTATAVDPDTGENVYEVIYVQMLDPMEPNGKHLPLQIKMPGVSPITITADDKWYPDNINSTLTVDSTGYEASNPNLDTYFPNSITNWRARIEGWVDDNNNGLLHERNYLPLWMRSIPKGQKQQIDYTLAIPLCFCKPGTSSGILNNITNSKFDFKVLDYTVDRYIINSVTSYGRDKYYIFKNDRITV